MTTDAVWDLPDRMRKARLLAGMEQAELAERIGISRNSVSNYERGKTQPSVGTFILWAKATGVSFEWLAATDA